MRSVSIALRTAANQLPEITRQIRKYKYRLWTKAQYQKPPALLRIRLLIRLLQIQPGLIDRTLRIVIGLHSLAILIHRAIALPRHIKNLPQLNMTPHLG